MSSSTIVNSTQDERNLALALQRGCNESVILELISRAANVNISDESGTTALFHAIQPNYKNVVCALIEAGADVNITDNDGKTPLFYAVRQRNNQSVVQELIKAHTDVNITDKDSKSALFYAVQQENNKGVVQALIAAGAKVNITDNDGKSALFYALEKRNSENVVQVLINAGANVNITDKEGKNVLFHAIKHDMHESVVLSLIDAGADVNAISTSEYNPQSVLYYAVQRSNNESVVRALIKAGANVNQTVLNNSSTALFFAVMQSKNESVVRALIDAGANVTITNDNGQTALFNAVRQLNNEGMIRTLIDAGANVNLVDKHGKTPLSYALFEGGHYTGKEKPILALIALGANVNISIDGMTALNWAIQQRHKESFVLAMIEAGAKADVNKTDNSNKTPLYYAVCNNNKGVISALLDAGADANLTYDGGETVLFSAVKQYNNEDVVQKLLAARVPADVNLTTHDGRNVLFYAVKYDYNINVVKMLIRAGADINKTDNNGQTILIHVIQLRYDSDKGEKARALINLGAEVDKRDNSGKTALLYAAQSNNENLVRTLIDAGADVHVTDSDGQNALFLAVQQRDNENVVRALIDAGVDVNTTDKNAYTALFYAVQQNKNEEVVKALIAADADINKIRNDGKTALFYAVQQNENEEVVKALIAADADINKISNDGKTALFYAVQQNENEEVVKALIEAGADVSITDKYGKTALFYAVPARYNNEGAVRALVEAEKDILTVKDIYGRTALFYINLGSPSPNTITYLLEKEGIGCLRLKDNCNVNILTFVIENCISQTGSCYKIKNGVLQKFIKQGTIERESVAKAIINIMLRKYIIEVLDNTSKEASHYNVRDLEELSSLYNENVDNNVWERTNKMETLMEVLKNNFRNTSEALELLVELGADPDSPDSDGNTALHITARSPSLDASEETVMDLCKLLKKFEVRFNARNHQNQTPLLFCISEITENKLQSATKTVVKVCSFLVKHGSSIEETSRDGKAVFHFIINLFQGSLKLHDKTERQQVLHDLIELLQLFLPEEAAKVAVNRSDVELNSPLHLWASLALPSPQDYTIQLTDDHTFQSILKLLLDSLLKCGARVNARNDNDETPLHLCKTWFALKMLIAAGANVKDVDSSRRSALLVAAKNQLFLENPDCFYPDVFEESKTFWKNVLDIGFDLSTADKHDESVLGILVASENYTLAKSLVDVECEESHTLSEGVTMSLLNAICKDKSTRTHWKAGLVQDILNSRKKAFSVPTALRFCCEHVMAAGVLNVQEQDKAVPMEVNVGESDDDDDDEPSRPKRRKVDQKELEEKSEALDSYISTSVHLEIIKILRWFKAADDEMCKNAAEDYPPLKGFLTSRLDINEIPKFIPWTSDSKRYEDKLAKVSRRQEHEEIGQYWYHKDHVASGSFGNIFVGINDKDGREVAIKRIETIRLQRPEDKREIKNLTALAYCEQVVRYIQCFENEHFSFIVLELMEGNLEEYLTSGSIFDAKKSVEFCQDVVKGLRYLHENDVLHRDLKPQNILFKTHPELCLKIADFGLSRRVDSTSTTVYGTNVGTRCWIAPEFLKGSTNLSKASDMFSCGLLLHYILSVRKHPFSPTDSVNDSEPQLAIKTEHNIMNNKMEGWDKSLSSEATHFIKWMLRSDETKRPTSGEILDHPFFYSRKKKIDLLEAVGNQKEFECPRAKRVTPLTDVENDLDNELSTIVKHKKWDDSGYFHMPSIYTEMTKKRKSYDTSSVVELVRFIRNAYAHVSDDKRPTPIRKMLLEDFVFLEYFPNLVMEVYKAVTTHGWDQSRDEIKYIIKN